MNDRPRQARLAAWILLSFVAGGTQASAQATLAWKLKPDTTYKYVLTQSTEQKAEVQGQVVETKTEQVIDLSWKVKSVENGVATVEQVIDRMQLRTVSPFAEIDFDSKRETHEGPAAQVAEAVKPIVGAAFELKMNAQGVMSDVKVPAELAEKLKAAGPGAAMLTNLASEDGLKNLLGRSGLILPEKAVSKEETWSNRLDLPLPFATISMDRLFSYQGPGETGGVPTEKIGVKLKIDKVDSKPDAPVQIKVNEQDGTGTFEFDPSGFLRSSEVTDHMVMTLIVQNMEIQSTADSKATMKYVP